MREQVGYQIGLSSQLPLRESGMINLIVSALSWQEEKGPCVIFVDEEFYRFLLRTDIESIYQDVIGLPDDVDEESANSFAKAMFNPVEVKKILNILPEKMTREEVARYLDMVPGDIKNRWDDMLMNEEMILSLGN